VRKVIREHKSSREYNTSKAGRDYAQGKNTTIMNYEKVLYDANGTPYIDKFTPQHRTTCEFFKRYVTQLSAYLLGNGVKWKNKDTANRLGRTFDGRLKKLCKIALAQRVGYGFFNLDHMDIFESLEFQPLFDEEDGAIKAGVRHWQIADGKPLRATLYELDGYQSFMWTNSTKPPRGDWKQVSSGTYVKPKRTYKITELGVSELDEKIYSYENYETFPIVPLYANDNKTADIATMRSKIDAVDLVANDYINDLDNAQLYWVIKGAGGMDDSDLMQFLDRLKTTRAAAPGQGQEVEPVTVSIPVEARERLLDRMEKALYREAMILDVNSIAGGAVVATQIKAAYEPQNERTDDLEYCIHEFLDSFLKLAGIDDEATFTRSVIINASEEIQSVVTASDHLSGEYVTGKILSILGDGDLTQQVLRQMDGEDMKRMAVNPDQGNPKQEEGDEGDDSE
jgi:hypothetical protein